MLGEDAHSDNDDERLIDCHEPLLSKKTIGHAVGLVRNREKVLLILCGTIILVLILSFLDVGAAQETAGIVQLRAGAQLDQM